MTRLVMLMNRGAQLAQLGKLREQHSWEQNSTGKLKEGLVMLATEGRAV